MTNQSENIQEANQPLSQEEVKPLFGGTDSQGKERLFTSVEDVQKSWQSSQDFIKSTVGEKQSLEAKVQELEAQLNQSLKLEDALAQLQNKEETPVNEPNNQQAAESTSQLDVEQLTAQITDSIMGKLNSSQQEKVHNANQVESMEAAQAVYGESFEDKLREAAQGLGMSDSDIVKTAQSNPAMFKKLFGLDKQQQTTYVPSSSNSGVPPSEDTKLNLGTGFTAKQKLDSHMSDLQAIAKKKGLDIKF